MNTCLIIEPGFVVTEGPAFLPSADPIPRPIPPSDELVDHHCGAHGCVDADSLVIKCPCNRSALVFCDECDEALFMLLGDGTWCEHAQDAWDDARLRKALS